MKTIYNLFWLIMNIYMITIIYHILKYRKSKNDDVAVLISLFLALNFVLGIVWFFNNPNEFSVGIVLAVIGAELIHIIFFTIGYVYHIIKFHFNFEEYSNKEENHTLLNVEKKMKKVYKQEKKKINQLEQLEKEDLLTRQEQRRLKRAKNIFNREVL